jgi:DNA-binding IclR family transcriptional regulator
MARPAPGADRSVAVLELLAAHPDERFTLSEVARRCSLNKATAHALLSALSARGVLLRHPEEKRYSLGPRLIAFGEAARHGYTAADFVPPVVEALASGTGQWARAWQVRGDQVVCVAQAGAPAIGGGPSVLPLIPPVGAAVMAWSDAPTREAWLARAASAEVVAHAVDALPTIRRRGYAVTLASDEWRSLTGPIRALAAAPDLPAPATVPPASYAVPAPGPAGAAASAASYAALPAASGAPAPPTPAPAAAAPAAVAPDSIVNGSADQAARRRALLLVVARQPLLMTDLGDASHVVADVCAPVFGAGGEVVLSLSVTTLADEPMTGTDVGSLGRQVAEAADGLTAVSQGCHPDGSVS